MKKRGVNMCKGNRKRFEKVVANVHIVCHLREAYDMNNVYKLMLTRERLVNK